MASALCRDDSWTSVMAVMGQTWVLTFGGSLYAGLSQPSFNFSSSLSQQDLGSGTCKLRTGLQRSMCQKAEGGLHSLAFMELMVDDVSVCQDLWISASHPLFLSTFLPSPSLLSSLFPTFSSSSFHPLFFSTLLLSFSLSLIYQPNTGIAGEPSHLASFCLYHITDHIPAATVSCPAVATGLHKVH